MQTLQELINEFIQKGGVMTIYPSGDSRYPIRYSLNLKVDGHTISGKTNNLAGDLEDILEDNNRNIDPLDDEALACVYGYDGPIY